MNRKTMVIAIGFLLAFCLGIHFYAEWNMAQFDASLPKPPVQKQQVADDVTDDTAGGHWHGDEWHAEPHVDNPLHLNTEAVSIPEIPHAPQLSAEEQVIREQQWKEWAKAYRAEWGDEPPWDGDYRHIRDEHGYARRQYWDKPVATHYKLEIGFAPTPAELQRYMNLLATLRNSESTGDTQLAAQIQAEMTEIVAANQSEIPMPPFGFIYQGIPRTIEEGEPLRQIAARELYELHSVGHLYEFYYADPKEIKGGY